MGRVIIGVDPHKLCQQRSRSSTTGAGDLREIRTVVSADNPASLRMLAALGEMRSDCANGDCDVVVQLNRSPAVARAEAA